MDVDGRVGVVLVPWCFESMPVGVERAGLRKLGLDMAVGLAGRTQHRSRKDMMSGSL